MKGISQWLSPLWIFVSGMIMLACSSVFYPAIGQVMSDTRAHVAARGIQESNYWGLAFSFSAGRLLVFLVGLGMVVVSALLQLMRSKQ